MLDKVDIFKEARLKYDFSQNDVAKVLNVSKSYISKIESGDGQYSILQMQLLMKKFNIKALQIKEGEVLRVNEYYYKGVLENNIEEKNYFIGNSLNDLVTIIKKYKNLTQEGLANLIYVSQNTVSSWQNFERKIDIETFSLILAKCNLINCYVLQDKIIVAKPYEDVDIEKSELYELAKIVCRYSSRYEDKIYSEVFRLEDCSTIDSKLRPFDEIYYASTEMECAYKYIDMCPELFFSSLKQDFTLNKEYYSVHYREYEILNENSTIDDFYHLVYENKPFIMGTILDDCVLLDDCEYAGEGIYLSFGDGGYCFSKLSTFLECAKNGMLDNLLGEPENENGLEDDIELVNKVYEGILRSIR